MKRLLFGMALALVAQDSSGRTRAVLHPDAVPMPKSVLWIAAHPDDEAVAAPLLAKWCIDEGARCGLLVMTRGEAGACALAGGCLPDVASTRSAEAGAASELFRAESMLLRYPDGGGSLPPRWSDVPGDQPGPSPGLRPPSPGGRGDLAARIAAHIEAFAPEIILTFDPRHGTTCHPDHRETGRLVLEAVEMLDSAPAVYLLETRVTFTTGADAVQFAAAIPGALRFDATGLLASGVEAWTALAWVMGRHPSQFTAEFIDAVRNVPPDQRAVFIAPAETALEQPAVACP